MAGHVKKPKEEKNKPNVVLTGITEIVQGTPAVFDSTALSIIKKDGKFLIVKVEINSETLSTGQLTIVDTAENKFEANEKFKINVVKFGII